MTTTGQADSTAAGTTTSGTTTTADSTEESGFDPPDAACGNGFVEAGEQCDDGNEEDGDSCNSQCQIPCGLQWSTLTLGPTLDSEIEALAVATDSADQVLVSGRLREVTVDKGGNVVVGEDTVVVQSHQPTGGLVWEQVLGSPDGDVFSAGVAVDAADDVYVASTVDVAAGGTAIRVTKLLGASGAEDWTHDFDGPFAGEDERAFDIAVGPDGQPVVSGQARAGDGDDDIWLRKLDAATGDEVWTTTYSGVGAGGFSTDDGGPLAIADDGSIYVLARTYVNFETQVGTLLRFGPDGGPATWTFTPVIEGTNQQFGLVDVTGDPSGQPVLAIERVDGANVNFWVYALDTAGVEQWSRSRADFEQAELGSSWVLEGLATTDEELVVLGRFLDDQRMPGTTWWEPWVSRLDVAGDSRCQVSYQGELVGLQPPSLFGYSVASTSDGSAVAVGEQASSKESGLWIASFRAQ